MRSFAVSSLAPSQSLLLAALIPKKHTNVEKLLQEKELLHKENRSLHEQIDPIRKWLLSEDRLEEQIQRIRSLDPLETEEKWKGYFQRRKAHLSELLKLQLKAIPAKVIYRDPASWGSFVWLGVGEKHNRSLQEPIIAKNSPVVMENVLVGIVEEVEEMQSKVRLITDASLTPSVRAVRGGKQDFVFLKQIEDLLQLLQTKKDLFSSIEEEKTLKGCLEQLMIRLNPSEVSSYLAKGELQGCSQPLWRSRGQKLKGIGFNYDFADEEGPARDLRTGEVMSLATQKNKQPLIQEGDLLVTTGWDGIFPEGLEVAIVSKVHCLKEGASSYALEADALAKLEDLDFVFILPPVLDSK
jgi:cell shape-determining protein MreC